MGLQVTNNSSKPNETDVIGVNDGALPACVLGKKEDSRRWVWLKKVQAI